MSKDTQMDAEQVEYELQHFNFCTDEIIAENRELMKFLIQSTYHSFTQEYIRQHNVEEHEAKELLSQSNATSLLIYEDCGPKLDEIGRLYRSMFTIPNNILLPSDLLHRKEYTVEQVDSMQATVTGLENQIRQDGVFLSMLDEELKLYEQLAPCIETEANLIELVNQHRQLEIVPTEDCAIVQEMADVMKDVMKMM